LYRDLISDVILKLQEDQKLQMLYNRWWKEKDGAGLCDVEEKGKKDANALAIANVGGVFVVLFVGLMLSIFVAIAEFLWNARRRRSATTKLSSEAGDDKVMTHIYFSLHKL
jgi:ionotropic glutamate receptor